MCLVIISVFWLWQLFSYFVEIRDTLEIKHFYEHQLHISEDDIQTIEWREIVQKVIGVPRLCITKERMTPLDVANRIMRKENYLIAMINKEVIRPKLPFYLPYFGERVFLTKTIEWSLKLTIFDYVFDNSLRSDKYNEGFDRRFLDSSRT
jgi:autophagy-related protein 9